MFDRSDLPVSLVNTMQSLWIGKRLSRLEVLSMRSFLAHGHEYHLYAYEKLDVPRGVVLKDARVIVERKHVYRQPCGSYVHFSDVFRYKLLAERGGWWVDTDVVCLRPFDFRRDLVFGWQSAEEVNNAVLFAKPGSRHMRILYDLARRCPPDAPWATPGPILLTKVAKALGILNRAEPMSSFYPIPCNDFLELIRRNREVPPRSYAVHLWHSIFVTTRIPEDATYLSTSIVGQLQRRYGVLDWEPEQKRWPAGLSPRRRSSSSPSRPSSASSRWGTSSPPSRASARRARGPSRSPR